MLTKIFYHILGLLVAFCLLFAVLITVTETLLYRVDGYFAKEYQKYAVTERVDMRLSDLLSVTDEMMDYLKGDRENLNVEAVIGGVQREFFNAKEKRHMQDVRELFLQGLALRRGAVFVGVLAAAFLCLKKDRRYFLGCAVGHCGSALHHARAWSFNFDGFHKILHLFPSDFF